MKKNIKKVLTIILTVSLAMLAFMACGKKNSEETDKTNVDVVEDNEEKKEADDAQVEAPASTDPLDMITEGYYTYSYFAEGYGDYTYYFHFYEEAPVIGAVFYAGFANNGMTFAGTYTVEQKDYEYELYKNRDDIVNAAETQKGTAPYTVTFYDWDGNLIDSCGFDGDILYNDMENIYAMGSGPVLYNHDTEGEASKYASTYAEEAGVAYLDFVADEDSTATLTLFHNMTYVDLVNMMIEGTWSMAANGEGGYDYTLTPYDATDTGAVLSVAADKKTAIYTPDGGTSMAMTNVLLSGAQVAYVFEGVQHIAAYNTDANLTLKLYDDNTCELEVEMFGSAGVMDTGTYEVNGYTINLKLDKAGEIQSELDAETQTVTVHYVASGTDAGDLDSVLTLNQDGAEAGSEILFSFTGGYTSFDCYTDNTFKFTFESYGIEETGTWEFDKSTYTFTITKSDGNTITATISGDDHSMNFEYTAVANDQLKDTFTCASDVWGTALMQ